MHDQIQDSSFQFEIFSYFRFVSGDSQFSLFCTGISIKYRCFFSSLSVNALNVVSVKVGERDRLLHVPHTLDVQVKESQKGRE